MQGLKATIQIGKSGLTKGVLEEINLQLKKKKIIKIKIKAENRDELIEAILQHTGASLVQKIGFTIVLKK